MVGKPDKWVPGPTWTISAITRTAADKAQLIDLKLDLRETDRLRYVKSC